MRLSLLIAICCGGGFAFIYSHFSAMSKSEKLSAVLNRQTFSLTTSKSPNQLFLLGLSLENLLAKLTSLLGVAASLDTRLHLARSTLSALQFRRRQVVLFLYALLASSILTNALAVSPLLAIVLVVTTCTTALLASEQRLSARATTTKARINSELAMFGERLSMLISAGSSLSVALTVLSKLPRSELSIELQIVAARIRQGLSVTTALEELQQLLNLDHLNRLCSIMSMHNDTSEIDLLLSREVSAIRNEYHRELIAELQRREQLVWIPVTVATLIPGVVFIAIPFMDALKPFTS